MTRKLVLTHALVLALMCAAVVATSLARPAAHGGTGLVAVDITDDAGTPIPCRLTFVGTHGTPNPRFTTTDIGREEANAIVAFDRAFVLPGPAEIIVPAGRYDVWISRGIEWSTAVRHIAVTRGGRIALAARLTHELDTPGWISADFHVHAAASFDSRVPMRDRAVQFASDGVDLIVATDHNVIADYGPIIDELGLEDTLHALTGDEITTADWGHFGAFPLPIDPSEAGGGAIPVRGRTPHDIFAAVRARAPQAIIDINHPRLEGGAMGYFHRARFDPRTLTAARPGFSTDFDAIEVLNGFQDADRRTLDAVMHDWFAFLDRGRRITATGNSDTHHLTFNLGGYPRNYVAIDDGAPIDGATVTAALRAQRAYFTTGPIVDVRVGTVGLGGVARAHDGKVVLHVTVRAASWIDVDALTIYQDGAIVATVPIAGAGNPRLDRDLPLTVRHDGYVVVRVAGPRPLAPIVGDDVGFRVTPIAVTNPIWLDADGDGHITPLVPMTGAQAAAAPAAGAKVGPSP